MPDAISRLNAALEGRYHIERELGEGGMAFVYLADDLRHGRKVALKVLKAQLVAVVDADRFMREIRMASSLRHPNILPLYDSGEADGLPYFAMPFIDGGSLRDRLRSEKQLPVEEAVRLTREIAAALGAAHAQGVIHRDVKPANVLLDDGRALVADFGIAKAAAEAGEETLTQSGVSIGTPGYISPEQGSAEPDIDQRTDIYSLACVLHEMLAGELLFTGSSTRAVVSKHIAVAPTPIRALRSRVPEGVESAILRALEKAPVDRWQTMTDFVEALDEGMAEGSSGALARKGVSRAPRSLSLAGVGLLVVGAAWWVGRPPVEPVSRVLVATPTPPVLGILPFVASGPQGDLGWIAGALEARVEQALASVEGLTLRSRQSISSRGGLPLDSLASLLDIDYFVEGQVESAQDTVTVAIQLVEGATGTVLANGALREPAGQPVRLADALTDAIEEILRPAVGRQVRTREWRAGTESETAFELLYRADDRARIGEALLSREPMAALVELEAADSLLGMAEAADRRWIEPPLVRARVADRRAFARAVGAADREPVLAALEEGRGHAERALEILPGSAAALAQRGYLRWRTFLFGGEEADVAAAAVDLRRALDADPSIAMAGAALSAILFAQGSFAEAQHYAEVAYRQDAYLDQTNVIINRIARSSFELEEDRTALDWCVEGIRRFPREPMHHACALEVLAWGTLAADPAAAWQHYEAITERAPPEGGSIQRYYLLATAGVLARAGLADSAQAVIEQARAHDVDLGPSGDPTPLAWESAVYYRLGDAEQAAALYERFRQLEPERGIELRSRRLFRPFLSTQTEDPR